MSLTVPEEIQALAVAGEVDDETFWSVVEKSLPFAVMMIEAAVAALDESGLVVHVHDARPPGEKERSQLLRVLASTPIREAIERLLGVRLGFVNCHFILVTRMGEDTPEWRKVTSPTYQIRKQSPELVDC